MTRQEFYSNRINEFKNKAAILQKRETRISVWRLITFVSGIFLFFALMQISAIAASVTLALCVVVFGWLVKYHSKTEQQKNFYLHLEMINYRESECIKGNYFEFTDGSEFVSRDHENSYDLDLFGHASLFQFINRTTSKPAYNLLADWLKAPAAEQEIKFRQQACLELKNETDWRQKLISLGYSNEHAGDDPSQLIKWVHSDNYFNNKRYLLFFTNLLSAFAIFSTILVAIFQLPFSLLVIVYLINFLFYLSYAKRITALHNQVGKSSEMLGSYASTIKLIEEKEFSCVKLKNLQIIFTGHYKVSEIIALLSRLVNRLDARLNIMVAIPLNLFYFWDIRCCYALENWKTSHAGDLSKWFSGMAEYEVLSCFANLAFNNPDWALPDIVPEYFTLEAMNASHPLIPPDRRVSNDITISGAGRTVIITGSNMSGKSTFLRTIGVNSVLAFAGSPVCAAEFRISYGRVLSSMRISDSLEDNTSSFYAELKKLENIIRTAEKNPRLLLLLDEILRGTNSDDRFTGSVALLKQLSGYRTTALIATHDLKLAGLSDELPGKIDNYHFDVKIEGEELYFDYKLTSGVCKSMNASILMKKMGIRLE
jgi:DNA mismatch repair ATPase MutS